MSVEPPTSMTNRWGSDPSDPPPVVECRFYGVLNDFLLPRRRGQTIRRPLTAPRSVKDLIESLGVPHTEVGLVVIGGEAVRFEQLVGPGDRVAVYPVFRSLSLGAESLPGPPPLPPDRIRFVLDGHLGRLAAYLRLCGFDVAYWRVAADDALAHIAAAEGRVLLTRDRGLLKRSAVAHGAFVRSDRPRDQLVEILARFDLAGAVQPFGRCLECNGQLQPVAREEVATLVPPRVFREQADFRRCVECRRLFWPGSHHARMVRLLESALGEVAAAGRR